MKKDFTSSQVMKGEVQYSLDDFWKDLLVEVEREFPNSFKEKYESVQRLAYQVIYASCIGMSSKEIDEFLGLPEGLAESLLDCHKEDKEMLNAIIMSLFLENLRNSFGLVNDSLNVELGNAQLRKFDETSELGKN